MPDKEFTLDNLFDLVKDYFSGHYEFKLCKDYSSSLLKLKMIVRGQLIKHDFYLLKWREYIAADMQYHQLENVDGEFARQEREILLQKPVKKERDLFS